MAVTNLRRKARPTNAHLQDQAFEIHDCLEALAERVTAIEGLLARLNAKAWMAVGAIALAILIAGLGILTQNFVLHGEVASKADTAVAVARSTKADTQADRDARDAREKAIDQKLNALLAKH